MQQRTHHFLAKAALSLVLAVAFLATPLHAQANDKKLSEDSVKAFIEETSALMSGQNLDMTPKQITTYLERHLDKKSRFRSTITYLIPGHAAQSKSLSLKKEDFMDYVSQGTQSLEHYENRISVDSIKISKDGLRAVVKTTGFETGYMPVPNEDGDIEDVPVEGQSECQQIIKLSKKRIIQMYSANCTTQIEFQQF